jgi:uncharacterized membrane protein YbhN (UPF0104 family)
MLARVPNHDADVLSFVRRPRIRFYAASRAAPTARRATDALLLVPALAGLVFLVAAYPPGHVERSMARFLNSLTGWPLPIWQALYDVLALWAIVLVVALVGTRRLGAIAQTVAAVALAAALALVATRVAVGGWPDLWDAVHGGSGSPRFPAFRVAEAGAVILTVSPHLVRGLQRVTRWVLVLGLVGSLFIRPENPGGNLAAVLIAVVAATSVRLAFGTSIGRPELATVAAALRELGVSATGLRALRRQVSGVFSLEAQDEAGRPLLVKIYGRDAYDTQLLATFWRTLWYQNGGLSLGSSRIQAVEHEALVTLLAARAQVPCLDVVAAGATAEGDALLVLRGTARSPARDADPAGWWRALARLGEARIAHRDLGPETVVLVGGGPGFADFGRATLTPTADELMTDRAQLLAATAAVAGEERAVHAAVDALGQETTAALLPYIQPPAFGGALRRALDEGGLDEDELRAATAAAAGTTEPELARLRRVTRGSLVQLGLLVFAVTALIRFAGHVEFDEVKADLQDAAWAWIAVGVVAAQLPRLTQAASTLGSIAATVRYGPVYVLQLATSYLNLALPSNLARMAVTIRFFQRQGLPPATAVAAGAIDSVVGNVIQLVIVLTLVLFASQDLAFDLDAPSSGALTLLWIAVGLLAATLIVLALVGRVRRFVAGRVREWWPQVKLSLSTLRSPNKLVLLVGGNLATEILFASALALIVRGFGYDIPLVELLLINAATSLFASFIPVPGGIGVVEFALEAGLTAAGMTPSSALAAILIYRAATFYLPPVWGFFAFRWLQRNRYL